MQLLWTQNHNQTMLFARGAKADYETIFIVVAISAAAFDDDDGDALLMIPEWVVDTRLIKVILGDL